MVDGRFAIGQGHRISKDILWSALGSALPMIAAVVAIPPLIHGIGAARFGLLSLAWMIVGYFNLFDLGLGRAMTQLVAERLGRDELEVVPGIVWTSLKLMAALGLVGAGLLMWMAPWLANDVLNIPDALRVETRLAFIVLACSIPFVITTAGLRGVLEAHGRFDIVNLVRGPMGVLSYFAPLAVLPYSTSLHALVFCVLAARLVSWSAFLIACLRAFPSLRRSSALAPGLLPRLLTFSGWMTVSNVAAPVLLYVGRILLAIYVSAEAVAYFSAPYDVVINLLVIPGIFVSVLFPTFTRLIQQNPERARSLYRKAQLRLASVMLPLSLLTFSLARPALEWWIDPVFAEHGFRVARWMAIGVSINSFGHVSQAFIQSHGRPDLTAKLHAAELLVYLPYSWWFIIRFGIEGAAIAWVIRVSLSTLALTLLARHCTIRSLAPKVEMAENALR